MDELIYLDNNATTKVDSRVLEAMLPFLQDQYGNASSNHEFGVQINQEIKKARKQVASLIGSEKNEIVFTSGATEAINLALKGITNKYGNERKHIVTVKTEHKAVLDTCKWLEEKGFRVTYLPVQSDGLLDLKIVDEVVTEDTLLVSVMFVNNETGVIQPIKKISNIAHDKGAFFMTDATQAVGKMPVDVNELGIDLMSFSGHKFHGPKGVGGLYIRSRGPNKVKPEALIHGGGHEWSYRSGTLNVPGIVGLGKAADIAQNEMEDYASRITILRNELENELLNIEGVSVNGNKDHRLYNITNIRFKGIDADALMIGLKNIMVSNGSACTSASIEPSHVLTAMGLNENDAYSSIRFSLGKFNLKKEIEVAIESVKTSVESLRQMSIT